jgi:hypothetical protein
MADTALEALVMHFGLCPDERLGMLIVRFDEGINVRWWWSLNEQSSRSGPGTITPNKTDRFH